MIGFEIHEEIGIQSIDSHSIVRFEIPNDWDQEKVDAFLAELETKDDTDEQI